MRYLQILPLLMALAAAILSGFLGFIRSIPQKEIMMQMVLVMIVFYILGLFTRSSFMGVLKQLDEKIKERELEEQKKQAEKEQEEEKERQSPYDLGKNIDLTADDMTEDSFDPIPVSEFIKNELNKE